MLPRAYRNYTKLIPQWSIRTTGGLVNHPSQGNNTFRHLPLEQEGAEGNVNENVITRAHDRSLPLRLRMFMKSNFCKKGFNSGGDAVKEPAGDWEAAKSLLAVQEALCNYGDVYRLL